MPSYTVADDFQSYGGSAGAKKFVSATAVADYGVSQAMVPPAPWPADVQAYRAIEVGGGQWINRSGFNCVCSIGVRFGVQHWGAGQVSAAGAYTDATAAAQNLGASDFVLSTGASSGSGSLFHASTRFNVIAVVFTVAGDQTAPVELLEYWNGSAWTTVPIPFVNDSLTTLVGERLLFFPMPHDWVRGGSGTAVPQHHYCLRYRQTNGGAGTTNPAASQIFLGFGSESAMVLSLANDSQASLARYDVALRFPPEGDALFPIFSVASAANVVRFDARYWAGNGG